MKRNDSGGGGPVARVMLAGGALAVVAACAGLVARSAHQTERAHPPSGKFATVNGVKLHYIERGSGSPIVLLHGNGVSAQDWDVSGVLDDLAAHHRVIAFDRPGFGYSDRPRDIEWTPVEQAALLHAALTELHVERPVVVGHSWGTLVALALALDYPADVASLVLLSGYYFASLRLDAPIAGMPAIPLLGDVLRYTISAILGRLLSPVLVSQLFAPAPVPERFARFPLSMSLRPSQLRASAQEALLMAPSAALLEKRYHELKMHVTIIAGTGDLIANPFKQSNRLAHLLTAHDAELIDGSGHMVHYFAPQLVREAVERSESSRLLGTNEVQFAAHANEANG